MNTNRRGPRFWWGALPLVAVLPALLLLYSCNGKQSAVDPGSETPLAVTKGQPWFEDVTKATGIDFTYYNGQKVAAVTIDGKPVYEKDKQGNLVLDSDGKPKLLRDKEGNLIGHLAILESL